MCKVMVGILVHVEETDYRLFRDLVGKGKIAQTLRNYVRSYAKADDLNHVVLMKRFEILSADKVKLDAEYFAVKEKLDVLDAKRKAEELSNLEAEKQVREQISQVEHDTMKAGLARKVLNR